MIKSFPHKGLKALYEEDSARGVQPAQVKRLRLLLARLEASRTPEDMDLPGLKLHQLGGSRQGTYAVSVSGNWRLTFEFDQGDAIHVNLEDYH